MKQEEELLVEKKITEAKLEVAEKRIQFLLWFFGILLTIGGVAIPLLLTKSSSEKVDLAISKMQSEMKSLQELQEKRFNDYNRDFRETTKDLLAQQNNSLEKIDARVDKALKETGEKVETVLGEKLSKPDLIIFYNGKKADGRSFDVTGMSAWGFNRFEIRNNGSAPAKDIKIILYLKSESQLREVGWTKRAQSEEKEFSQSFIYNKKIDDLYTNDQVPIETNFSFQEGTQKTKEQILLRIYCEGIIVPAKQEFSFEIK